MKTALLLSRVRGKNHYSWLDIKGALLTGAEFVTRKADQIWENPMESIQDASHIYEVERRVRHAERPGLQPLSKLA